VELDEVTERYERVPTPRDLHVACGTIPAGTCGAVRAETTGVVGGHPAITIEHINRMAADLAPEWATAPRGTYRLIIEGEPHIQCDLTLGVERTAASANDNAMEATAMRVVNAIPYVVAAAPGIATSLDLPITAPRNAFDFSRSTEGVPVSPSWSPIRRASTRSPGLLVRSLRNSASTRSE
jgi:hypothetical protein